MHPSLVFLMIQCTEEQTLVLHLLFYLGTSGTCGVSVWLLTFALEYSSVPRSLVNMSWLNILEIIAVLGGFIRRCSAKLNPTFCRLNLFHSLLLEIIDNIISINATLLRAEFGTCSFPILAQLHAFTFRTFA